MKKMMALGLAVVMAMATLTGCGSSDSGKKTAKVVEIDLTRESRMQPLLLLMIRTVENTLQLMWYRTVKWISMV